MSLFPPSLRLKEPQAKPAYWQGATTPGRYSTFYPGIRKSRISWYQNQPNDFSS
jgi:hypothetical protein